ncbi:hypothetical protein QTP70_026354 [Hemibagrus guttatus]|uniref:Uncharacterized protein n=1 Tax=Hemibagrus guttatus TaxID=175788 RepID=A0AAE0VAV7_9TELE|nr:hypothetical protein QTP70_026354 [Hemibagrus guttatus]
MSQKPDSLSRVWVVGAPAHDCYPKHMALDPYAPSCGWWAYGKVGLCLFFGLCPAESRRQRLGHQALACMPQPQAWLQGGAPVTPVRATGGHSGLVVSTVASHLQVWGFDFCLRHVCVEFACSPCASGVSSGYSGFLPWSKDISKLFVVCDCVCALRWVATPSRVYPALMPSVA